MTQHILIRVNQKTGPKFIPFPEVASVWRDDQTITWQLQGGLFWDPPPDLPYPENLPVFFMPADDSHAQFPGEQPSPVGALTGEQDTRVYVTLCGKIIPTGDLPETYHWAAWVNDGNTRQRVQTLAGELLQDVIDFVDPDLTNQPLP